MYLLNLDGAEHGIVAEPATATTGLIGSSHLATSATRLYGCKSLMIGSLYSAVGLARQMQKSTPSKAPEVRRKWSFSQSLAGAMRVRALGPPRRDPSSWSACN